MKDKEQYLKCCLDPFYYQQAIQAGEIIFSDRYYVEHVDHWTRQPLKSDEIMISSGFYPGVKCFYPANRSTESTAKKACRDLFDNLERNCNTCIHLQRISHPKHPLGTLYASCQKRQIEIKFHPDDSMLMECYESRNSIPESKKRKI